MADTINKTVKDNSLDGVFTEVPHDEKLGLRVPEKIRLFYLDIRNNRFDLEKLKTKLYFNLGQYAFSRAMIDRFTKAGNKDAIISQAQRILRGKGVDIKGTGAELGELLLYVFLEEKLGAPKLMSRIETAVDCKDSLPDNIHLLPASISGEPYHQIVFGASSIVGEIKYAINEVFKRIACIEQREKDELTMIDNLILHTPSDRFAKKEDIAFLQRMFLPVEGRKQPKATSYAVFLGYTIGLAPENYSLDEFPSLVEEKIVDDLKRHLPLIVEKIRENNLGIHSFYFYIVPFNDAETNKKAVMEDILKGDVNLWPT